MSEISFPTNVLVVGASEDDLSGVLNARPTLAPYWNIYVVESAAEAERILADDDAIDAVIVTSRLPDGDGLGFLEIVRSMYPHLARILLTSARSAAADLGLLAHEILDMPVEIAHFFGAIESATALQRRIEDPALHGLLGKIEALPSPPQSLLELNRALRNPEVEVATVAKIVENDVAITARLLRIVNSAFFGLNAEITNTRQAVAYLGIPTVRTLIGSFELLNALQPGMPAVATAVEDIHAHSLAVAELAQSFMHTNDEGQDAYVAGMMHDVGLLALVSCAPVTYLALREEVLHSGRTLNECELDVVGASHAAIGAYVLDLWGFPSLLVEAVARSHDADRLSEWKLDPMSAVFVAEQEINHQGSTESWEGSEMPSAEYLHALGLSTTNYL